MFDQPGTTRDVVGTDSVLGGWPIELWDTAGIRSDVSENLEHEGIERAQAALARSDIVVLVSDQSPPTWLALPSDFRGAVIRVRNKIDQHSTGFNLVDVVETSVSQGIGLEPLMDRIVAQIVPSATPPQAVLFTPRQKRVVEQILEAFETCQFKVAAHRIDELLDGPAAGAIPTAPGDGPAID